MEGDPEESDEDVQGEDKPTVLWEKCIQQSIFVDLSEDESIHLSDLDSSLALHLSQVESAESEASIHLSGSAELSGLDDTSSESGSVSSQSVGVVKSKSSILHESAQRPNTRRDKPSINQDPGENTSDEEHDDLPYDGVLGSPYFNQTAGSEGNTSSNGRHTVQASPELPDVLDLLQEDTSKKQENFFEVHNPSEVAPPGSGPADINQLLLRHFSQEELLRSGRLIEAETLPEVSLLESVDDTALSLASVCHSVAINRSRMESYNEKSHTVQKNTCLEEETEIDHLTSAVTESNSSSSKGTGSDQSSENIRTDGVKPEKTEEDDQVQRVPLLRTRSFSEMKYGQGQVHYPLPDFSKVAPKVKIPKTPSGSSRCVPQSPSTIQRAQSSPGILDVISRVLEDSVQPPEKPYVVKADDKQSPPALVHHLQAEYDKLLTKYAEAENLIDQMRLGTNTQPSSELGLYLGHDDDEEDQGDLTEGNYLEHLPPHFPSSENMCEKEETPPQSTIKKVISVNPSQLDDGPSDGERMTSELRDIISHFLQKVEEFKVSVSSMALSTAEQQIILRSMMEAQDQLERKYISKKDEHRALEMQNYMGLSRNTGTFDPNRQVEGDIFRIGMYLEDIKEVIDKNVCDQISSPLSSSTPTPVTVSRHVNPAPVCMPTPSPPPSLHEGPGAGFSCHMDTRREELKEEEVEEASELHVDVGLDQSSEIISADFPLQNAGCNKWLSGDSLGSLRTRAAEDEEGNEEERSSVLSEVTDHIDPSGTRSTSRQRRWTANSSKTLDTVPSPKGECDLFHCASLAVEVSSSSDAPGHSDSCSLSENPLNASSVSQGRRIVSPETDSGFGSSYLNQSASGSFQANVLTESVQSPNEGLSSSDSEGSCSNLQTAIHSAALIDIQWESSHPPVQRQRSGAAAAVELWVESTTKEPSVRLQGSDHELPAQLHHRASEPVLSTSMDTEDRGSPLNSCSCNSEAILALQSEVSRLKKNLEEGLVQLPHLAQKMDYLTSKYKQERQGRRSKTRIHPRPAGHSVETSSSRGVSNLSSSQVKIEDWISTDMDPSKSKGTNSGDTSCSENMTELQSSPAGSRRRGRSVHSAEFEYELQQTTQSKRAIMKSFSSKDRWSLLSTPSLQKPLLQVSYGSSCSLPASYKVREPQLQSTSHHRKRSTQSDSALLPSNVYFQRTLSPVSVLSKTGSRTNRRSVNKLTGKFPLVSQEEDMNRTLDQAIEVALSMKRTTDRMARRLSADLSKAQLHRRLNRKQPQGGRKHQAL
ncbi:protein AKNAD1-like isoform X3 [Mugil cephalus]|uniref:protein AKNAD1-like isoform X3 n=1 Tax=Mugil cephalus TaxID=48193 RepID=UPI001FB62FFF|nr:protein AKNAD1-like isoform X3 [Mugil cephalus]